MKRIALPLIAILAIASFCGCDRNIFKFGGKDAPKDAPEYTVTAEQSANK